MASSEVHRGVGLCAGLDASDSIESGDGQFKALASAVLLFVLNLVGLGLGPWFAGFLSDALEPSYGVQSVRYALLTMAIAGNAWATLHYFLGARTLNDDLRARDRL